MKLINLKSTLTITLIATLILASVTLFISKELNTQTTKERENTLANVSAKKTSDSSVTALGRIEPKNAVIKLTGPSYLYSGRVIQILVKEQEQVKQGQVIAILDIFDKQQAALKAAKEKVQLARSQLNQVLAGTAKKGEIAAQEAAVASLKAEFQGQIATQKTKIARLKIKLLKQKNVDTAAIMRLKANSNQAEIDCQRYENLFKDGATSNATRDSKCLEAKTALQQLKETEANQEQVVTTLPQEISEAESTMKQILSTFPQKIAQAKAILDQLQEVRPVDIEVSRSQLKQAIAEVGEAQSELELAYVKAPFPGQILKIHTWPGESIGSNGIVDFGQTQEMYVVAEVYETDIGQIKLGQIATISSKSLPFELQGQVEQIGLQVGKKAVFNNDPSLDMDARIFEVKIKINSDYLEKITHLINLQVEVNINTNS
ncbi:HlyD family efflux transporter periplasmic adaptor subunit [Nostoc sp.]|uniref:HlyD family efflux transporter periplasmic adaptor subunit n=1 Tax=Nostoc sp. TaxID=1180 RepID=UPI002FFB3839